MVHGAQGVSKSYFGRMYAYDRCLSVPGFRVLLLRRTYDELNKNHMQFMESEARALGAKWTQSGINAKQMRFLHGDDPEAIIFAGSCQDEGDIKAHVGPEYDLILLEEGVTLLTKAIREIMARDRGSAPARPFREKIGLVGQTRILTNPGGVAMNYLKRLFIDKNADAEDFPGYNPIYFDQMTGEVQDNPYLPENFVEKSLGHLDPIRRAQLAEGKWNVFEGQFFQMPIVGVDMEAP